MAKARGSQNGDTPFVFKSKNGTITIPASEKYDPDMDAMVELDAARRAEVDGTGDEVRSSVALLAVIRSGFSPKTAEKIRLKGSEMIPFMQSYMKHVGADLPKSTTS